MDINISRLIFNEYKQFLKSIVIIISLFVNKNVLPYRPPSEDNPEPKWKIIISKIYAYDPGTIIIIQTYFKHVFLLTGFKFPLRFLAAMIITAVILYQVTLIKQNTGALSI